MRERRSQRPQPTPGPEASWTGFHKLQGRQAGQAGLQPGSQLYLPSGDQVEPCGGPPALCSLDLQTPQLGCSTELCDWGLRVSPPPRLLADVLLIFNDAALFVGYLRGCVGSLPAQGRGIWLGRCSSRAGTDPFSQEM